MNIVEFAAQVILLSASGVLYPGPLLLANLFYGSKEGIRSSIKIALGHTIVELPLILILSLGLISLSSLILKNEILRIIGIIGGIAIILFSLAQISSIIRKRSIATGTPGENGNKDEMPHLLKKFDSKKKYGSLIVGIAFTALNPFFITWWLTIGLKLISDSIYIFGVSEGIFVLFSSHIWMDYAWLSITGYLVSKGKSLLKGGTYNLFLLLIDFFLIFYGLRFVLEGVL
jgi:threonine/homoserine/homoserine lactone efflux protein